MGYTREQLEMLERQREFFAGDECLLARAALWRDASPQECWEAVREECRLAEQLISQYPPDVRERALAREPLPADTIALLQAMQKRSG